MRIDEHGSTRLTIPLDEALEYVLDNFCRAAPGAYASDAIWTVADALKKAEAQCERYEAALENVRSTEWCKANGNYLDAWRECNAIAREALAEGAAKPEPGDVVACRSCRYDGHQDSLQGCKSCVTDPLRPLYRRRIE